MENNYNQNNLQQPNTLVFGILGLALCSAFGIFAVIFGAIGKSKAKKFIAEGGQLAGASKVGYILSKIAFVLGIISLVCYHHHRVHRKPGIPQRASCGIRFLI